MSVFIQCAHVMTIMLIFDHEFSRSADIKIKDVFALHPLLLFTLVMK